MEVNLGLPYNDLTYNFLIYLPLWSVLCCLISQNSLFFLFLSPKTVFLKEDRNVVKLIWPNCSFMSTLKFGKMIFFLRTECWPQKLKRRMKSITSSHPGDTFKVRKKSWKVPSHTTFFLPTANCRFCDFFIFVHLYLIIELGIIAADHWISD